MRCKSFGKMAIMPDFIHGKCLKVVAHVKNAPTNGSYKKMDQSKKDFYQTLRVKIQKWLQSQEGATHKWAEYLMCAPDLFHLLVKLSIDDQVPTTERLKILGAIAYFISPFDFIPEALLGPAAFLDDIVLAAYVLNSLMSKTDPEIIRKHWAGDEDALEIIQKIINMADKMINAKILQKIKSKF